MNLSRRRLLIGAVSAAGLVGTSKVFATAEDVDAAIKALAGDADVTEGGGLKLNAPEIAENGNSVPISVIAEGEVESITLFADGNPRPDVITFNFTPNSGEAFASTRMRLAKTQNVIAVAKLSDGSVVTDSSNIKVTIGGCGG